MTNKSSSKPVPHAWSGATETKLSGLTQINEGSRASNYENGSGGPGAVGVPLMSVDEAERLVEEYKPTPVVGVGSSSFLKLHTDVERLNLVAHQCAQGKSDEFVLEAILTFGQLTNLVKDLLAIEAWRESVLPLLSKRLADNNNKGPRSA